MPGRSRHGAHPSASVVGEPLSHVDQAGLLRDELGFAEVPVLPLAGVVVLSGALVAAVGKL